MRRPATVINRLASRLPAFHLNHILCCTTGQHPTQNGETTSQQHSRLILPLCVPVALLGLYTRSDQSVIQLHCLNQTPAKLLPAMPARERGNRSNLTCILFAWRRHRRPGCWSCFAILHLPSHYHMWEMWRPRSHTVTVPPPPLVAPAAQLAPTPPSRLPLRRIVCPLDHIARSYSQRARRQAVRVRAPTVLRHGFGPLSFAAAATDRRWAAAAAACPHPSPHSRSCTRNNTARSCVSAAVGRPLLFRTAPAPRPRRETATLGLRGLRATTGEVHQ